MCYYLVLGGLSLGILALCIQNEIREYDHKSKMASYTEEDVMTMSPALQAEYLQFCLTHHILPVYISHN